MKTTKLAVSIVFLALSITTLLLGITGYASALGDIAVNPNVLSGNVTPTNGVFYWFVNMTSSETKIFTVRSYVAGSGDGQALPSTFTWTLNDQLIRKTTTPTTTDTYTLSNPPVGKHQIDVYAKDSNGLQTGHWMWTLTVTGGLSLINMLAIFGSLPVLAVSGYGTFRFATAKSAAKKKK